MKRKVLMIVCTVAVSVSACGPGSADKKIPALSNEMCDCFSNFQKDLSPEIMDLMRKVSTSANPRQEMQAGLAKLKPEEADAFIKKFQQISEKTSDVNKCMQEFDKRHGKETTRDKRALTEKMLQEMRGNNNCPVGAVVVSIGLQVMK